MLNRLSNFFIADSFASSRASPDVGVDRVLDPAEPELRPGGLGDGVARASLK
jgi:hypothetical protein